MHISAGLIHFSICVLLFCVVLSCVGRELAMGRSPVQGV